MKELNILKSLIMQGGIRGPSDMARLMTSFKNLEVRLAKTAPAPPVVDTSELEAEVVRWRDLTTAANARINELELEVSEAVAPEDVDTLGLEADIKRLKTELRIAKSQVTKLKKKLQPKDD